MTLGKKNRRVIILLIFFLLTAPLWYYLLVMKTGFFTREFPLHSLKPAGKVSSIIFSSGEVELKFRENGGFFLRRQELPLQPSGLKVHISSLEAGIERHPVNSLAGKSELRLLFPDGHTRSFQWSSLLKSGKSHTVFFPFSKQDIAGSDEIFLTFFPDMAHFPHVLKISRVEVFSFSQNWYLPAALLAQGRYRAERFFQSKFPWVTLENISFWNFAGIYLFLAGLILLPLNKMQHYVKPVFLWAVLCYLGYFTLVSGFQLRTLHQQRKILLREVEITENEEWEAALLSMLYASPYQLDPSLLDVVIYLKNTPGTLYVYRANEITRYFLRTFLQGKDIINTAELRLIPMESRVLLSVEDALEHKKILDEEFALVWRKNTLLLYRRVP